MPLFSTHCTSIVPQDRKNGTKHLFSCKAACNPEMFRKNMYRCCEQWIYVLYVGMYRISGIIWYPARNRVSGWIRYPVSSTKQYPVSCRISYPVLSHRQTNLTNHVAPFEVDKIHYPPHLSWILSTRHIHLI